MTHHHRHYVLTQTARGSFLTGRAGTIEITESEVCALLKKWAKERASWNS